MLKKQSVLSSFFSGVFKQMFHKTHFFKKHKQVQQKRKHV